MGLPCPHCDRIGCKGQCQNNNPPDDGGNDNEEPQKVDLDLIVDGLGVVTGAGSYKPGTNVKITAIANTNNIFGGWSEDGALLSDASSYTFKITNYRCLTANFYQEGSECWNLYKKYKYNTILHNSFNNLMNDIRQKDSTEFLYKMSSQGVESKVIGAVSKIEDLGLVEGEDYSYLIHNHTSDIPIPSLGDLYQLYKISNDGYLQDKSCFIIYGAKGTLSIEITNQASFNAFIANEILSDNNYDETKGEEYDNNYKKLLGIQNWGDLLSMKDSLFHKKNADESIKSAGCRYND